MEIKFDENSISVYRNDKNSAIDKTKKDQYHTWLKIQMEARINALNGLLGFVKSYVTDYVQTTVELGDGFNGDVGLVGFEFYEEYLEMDFNTIFTEIGDESEKLREVDMVGKTSGRKASVEVLLDENFLNSILAALYHLDFKLNLREWAGANPDAHMYSDTVDGILKTHVLGQAWPELLKEFKEDSNIDAECSLGKGIFHDKIRGIRPPGL